MHMLAHAALTLFYKRLFFFQTIFFFKISPFSKTNLRYTLYHLFGSNKNPVVVPDLGPFCLGEKSPDDTSHLTQPHSMGSNTACWFVKYGLSNAISEDPNGVPEFQSQNNFKILIVI